MSRSIVAIGVTALFAAVIAGCGGGGGGGSNLTEIISPQEFERRRAAVASRHLANSEFRAQWGLESTNVHAAHAALEVKYGNREKPGAGVTVGVIDSGVNRNHFEFRGASITEIPTGETSTDLSHGTAVTSVIAAQSNRNGFIGVAPGPLSRCSSWT